MITPSVQQVAVSADPVRPFGAVSFYEFYINCDFVRTIGDTYGHKNPVCLGFWKGDEGEWDNFRMTMHMRDDGDLVVWPRAFHFDRTDT